MVYQITDGKLSIDDFELPNGCYLEPVKHDEMRYCVDEGSTASYYIWNKATLERRQVLPPDVERVRMLILGLDEGSIGTAGVAAGAFLLEKHYGRNLTRYRGSSGTSSWQMVGAATKSSKKPSFGQHTSSASTIGRLGVGPTTA